MADTEVANPESAVRAYLTYLSDPSQLVDATQVAKLEKKVAAAKDPVDKLLAIAAVDRAKHTDPGAYVEGFVANAKNWATAEGVPASAFRSMGVPDDVLRAAGLDSGKRRRARATTGVARARRPSVRADQLESGILGLSGEFTIRDVADQVGGSTQPIRSALDRLAAQGKVSAAGERTGGRGRAAKTWRVA